MAFRSFQLFYYVIIEIEPTITLQNFTYAISSNVYV